MPPRLILLDADGTLWRGASAIDGAPEFVRRVKAAGIGCVLVSNNAGPDRNSYVEKCRKLNLDFSEHEIFSVNHLAGPWIAKNYPGKRVLVIGSDMLVSTMRNHAEITKAGEWLEQHGVGHRLHTPDDLKVLNEAEFDVVLIGIDVNASYLKLALASVLVQRGAQLVGANPDYSFPFEGGHVLPGNGSIVSLVASVAGVEPEYLGKPSLHLLSQIEEETGVGRGEMLMIGDRIEIDIEFARRAGMASYLVMTGVCTDASPVADMADINVAASLTQVAQELKLL
jgi:4-nitrophenyl phosphatase